MFFRGPEWLDGTKVAGLGLKMHIFDIFGTKVTHKQIKIKNFFCAYSHIKKILTDISSNPRIFLCKLLEFS